NQGLELLKQGTSTNNTEDESAGYSWSEDSDESFERVFKGYERFESESITSKQDGQVLADGLGIDTEFFRQVAHANGRDQLEAKAMNRALYPATLGYFLEEMLNPLATEKDIAATEYFFSTYV